MYVRIRRKVILNVWFFSQEQYVLSMPVALKEMIKRLISFSMKWQPFNKISDELLKHVFGQVYSRNTSLK